jgi:hypothetical protein
MDAADRMAPSEKRPSQNELLARAKAPKSQHRKSDQWVWEDFDGWPADPPHSGAQLLRLIEDEIKLRRKLRLLAREPTQERLKACRAWWEAVQNVLEQAATQPDRSGTSGDSPKIPRELLLALSGVAGYVAVGEVPDPIKWATSKRGQRAMGPTERRDIGWASVFERCQRRTHYR